MDRNRLPRHLSNTDFVALVRDGWIGSRAATSALLQQIITESLESGRSVTLARTSDAPEEQTGELEADRFFEQLVADEPRSESTGEVIDFDELLDDL